MSVPTSEKLVRIVYFPVHFNNSRDPTKLPIKALFKPRRGQGMSILRLDYSDMNFCKSWGLHCQDAENRREYWGLAVVSAGCIYANNARVIGSPMWHNGLFAEMHGDIWHNLQDNDVNVEWGEPTSSALNYFASQILQVAHIEPDNNKASNDWEGGDFKQIDIHGCS